MWGPKCCIHFNPLVHKFENAFLCHTIGWKILLMQKFDHPPRLSLFVGKLNFALQVKTGYNSLWLHMVLDKLWKIITSPLICYRVGWIVIYLVLMWTFQKFCNFKTPHDRQKGSLVVEGHICVYLKRAKRGEFWHTLLMPWIVASFMLSTNRVLLHYRCVWIINHMLLTVALSLISLSGSCVRNGALRISTVAWEWTVTNA